jgi:hypothetical protein
MPLWFLASQGLALHIRNTPGTVFTFGSVLQVPFLFRRLGTAPFLLSVSTQRLIERIWDDSHFPYSGGLGLKVLHLIGYSPTYFPFTCVSSVEMGLQFSPARSQGS